MNFQAYVLLEHFFVDKFVLLNGPQNGSQTF